MKKLTSISAFFPAYNEEGNITKLCMSLQQVLPEISDDHEIIIVNDGSIDGTKAIAEQLAREKSNIRVVNHATNLGYGSAIRSGIRACNKDYIFFTDGDNQFDVMQLKTFVPYLSEYDAVIGFRVDRKDNFIRKLNARAWNALVNWMFGIEVKDIDCAFKLFHKRVFDEIKLESTGALISTELLVKVKSKFFSVYELGVEHYPRHTGEQTGANLHVIIRAFQELFRFYKKTRRENINHARK
jgi:glycosyltransferase involved in cell wall biosynthesis